MKIDFNGEHQEVLVTIYIQTGAPCIDLYNRSKREFTRITVNALNAKENDVVFKKGAINAGLDKKLLEAGAVCQFNRSITTLEGKQYKVCSLAPLFLMALIEQTAARAERR